jgi:DnaK suppressor protein
MPPTLLVLVNAPPVYVRRPGSRTGIGRANRLSQRNDDSSVVGSSGTIIEAEDSPMSSADSTEIRAALQAEAAVLRAEHDSAVTELEALRRVDLLGGPDEHNFEREQQRSIVASRRGLLSQVEHALRRLDAGGYGICENCGREIDAARLETVPMATLHDACKAGEQLAPRSGCACEEHDERE